MVRSAVLSEEVAAYVASRSTQPDPVARSLIERTAELGGVSGMQIGIDQGWFLTVLTRLVDPTFAIEIGTFTGYSALCIARGLGPDGRLVCCDVSEEWTSIGREHWERAGVADRIELRLAPAIDTLRALDEDTTVDLVFIDADKGGYLDYYEELLPRLSPDGVMCVDNTLWGGAVLDPRVDDGDTAALRNFNDHVAADERVEQTILTIGDGLTLIRRR